MILGTVSVGGGMTGLRLPTYFLSHGGGPWPWIKDRLPGDLDRLEASLAAIPGDLPSRPEAILCISAHWIEPTFTIQRNAQPAMLYDYGGFPDFTYEIEYRAPGSPELADRVASLLGDTAISSAFDQARGFDHGVFAPLYVIYPDADVPIVQLSIRTGFDPAEHLALGRALAPLRDEGVLILGSGLSYHNMRGFGPAGRDPSIAFDDWLTATLTTSDPEARAEALLGWESAPAARIAHPSEDHLIPLLVAVGAAERDPATRTYHQDDFMGSVAASSYRFG
jgi:aromatic ring-opening dioxygenase catalytic subunit (LigB family)